MRRTPARFWIPCLLLALAGCGGDGAPTGPAPGTSPRAAAYFGEALDVMQAHSVVRKTIDWTEFRARALSRAVGAQTPADTYGAIRAALRDLGDRHSFFVVPTGASASLASTAAAAAPTGQMLDSRLAYVRMPEFSGSGANMHAAEYHRLLYTIDAAGKPCGWVVDLRGNRGGNMWPMLAGIGPVLGEGEVGAFVDPDGRTQTWFYRGGEAGLIDVDGTRRVLSVPWGGHYSRRGAPPVAVLTDGQTASSGEAMVVAFRGRPDTRSFGSATYGIPTANQSFRLSDGAQIFLTVSWDADRTGRRYDGPIAPDVEVGGGGTAQPLADDAVVRAASAWLMAQVACR